MPGSGLPCLIGAGRIVMVSGGGTGIGRAVAERFARQGDRVTVLGRRAEVP